MESHAAIFTADDLENIRKANEEISMWGNQILVWLGQSLGAVKELGKEWGGFLGLRSNKEFSVGDDGKVHETTEKDRRRKADADALAAHKDNLSNEAAASKQQYDRDMEAYNKYVEWKRGRGMEGMGGRQKITNLYVAIQQEEDAAKAETVYQKKIEHWKKITELQGKLAGEEKSLAEKQRSEQEKYNSLKEREMSIRAEILRKENDVGAFDLKDLAKRAAFKNATHQKLSTNEKNALEARHEFDALEESRASGDAVGVKLHEGKYLGLVGGNDALKSGERDPAGKSERHLEKIQTDMAKLAAACSAQGIKIDTGETQ
jgi:hypothetical protein